MQKRLQQAALAAAAGPRLVDDAQRLWRRVRKFIAMRIVDADLELDPIELACYALQLPIRQAIVMPTGRQGRTGLRDRAEAAAEQLVGQVGDQVDESLLDRTARILHELPQRSPVLDEAKLLADAVNLDDFGIIGFTLQAMQTARSGDGLTQLAEGAVKREQYGYWDARLNDGFHFEQVRVIASRRLESYRQAGALLNEELVEDTA